MSLRDDIIEEVNKHKGRNSGITATIASVFRVVSPFIAFRSLPASIVLWIISYAVEALWGKENLKEKAMPDDWVKQVSESDGVSSKGIQLLHNRNEKKGYISVQDAIDFLEVENVDGEPTDNQEESSNKVNLSESEIQKFKEEISESEKYTHYQSDTISGAESLKRRAEKERKDFIDIEGLGKGLSQIAKSFNIESGVDSLKRSARDFFNRK